MNDDQIYTRIVYCMAAAALATTLIVIAILTDARGWAAVALLPALTSLAAVTPVLLALRKQRP